MLVAGGLKPSSKARRKLGTPPSSSDSAAGGRSLLPGDMGRGTRGAGAEIQSRRKILNLVVSSRDWAKANRSPANSLGSLAKGKPRWGTSLAQFGALLVQVQGAGNTAQSWVSKGLDLIWLMVTSRLFASIKANGIRIRLPLKYC